MLAMPDRLWAVWHDTCVINSHAQPNCSPFSTTKFIVIGGRD